MGVAALGMSVVAFGIGAAPLQAQAADAEYFPLQVGNQWIYQTNTRFFNGPANVVSIPGKRDFGSTSYFIVEGLDANPVYMRSDDMGKLFVYDERTGGEAQYADFTTPVGGSYQTAADPCNATANVMARDATVTTPVGEFTGALHVEYPSANCADAGLGADYFVPNIGLVKREGITIAGPRAMELVYARVGDVTVLSSPEVSFSMSIDRAVYDNTNDISTIHARLTLRSTMAEPIDLHWAGGQRFDLVIYNERGAEVARWSNGKAFTLELSSEKFGPGERNYTIQHPLQDRQNNRLPAGKYVAEGFLTTQGEQKPYGARVGFEIISEAEAEEAEPAQP